MARVLVKDSDFLKKARERYKHGNEADDKQARRERDDIAFEDGNQWPDDILNARKGQQATNGLPAVPARPSLVIDNIRPSVRQVLNQEREASIGVEITPADDFGDLGITPDDTENPLREGLIRRIQRESKAADARSWAFKRAVIAGRGFYLVMTRYLPGKSWDQEVYVHRLYNQAGVILDPSHEQPDGSDADWGFIGTWVPWDRFKDEYPTTADGDENPFKESSEADFTSMTEDYPDWYKADGEQRAVRVVDYWYTERTQRTLVSTEDGQSFWQDELPEGRTGVDTRTVIEKHIKFCKIGGGLVELERTDWAGPDMPIIKVLGEEILPYDGERRAEGMVRPARDSQMGLNFTISRYVEDTGNTALTPTMVDPDAIDGYEAWWAQSNTRAFPYLPYRRHDDQGRELFPPTRPPKDNNPLALMQGIALFKESIDSTTAVPETARGQTDPSVKSARHARYLIDESRLGTSNFLDNLVRSVRYEGQVENGLLYPIYGAKPGRLVRIMTGEGEPQTILISDPEQQQQAMVQRQKAQKVAKLTKDAQFNVTVKVSKSFNTRREQIVGMLGDIISADPTQMMVSGDILYKNMDIPESKQLAKRMRVMLAPPVQALLAAEEQGQQFDPVAQAKIAELQQQVEHANAAIKQLAEIAHGKTVEMQGKLQVEQLQAEKDVQLEQLRSQVELEKARMDNATKIHVAEIAAKTKGVIQAQEMEHEAIALAHTHQHESEQAELDRENLARQQASDHAHEASLGIGGKELDANEAERGRQATADENERNRQAAKDTDA